MLRDSTNFLKDVTGTRRDRTNFLIGVTVTRRDNATFLIGVIVPHRAGSVFPKALLSRILAEACRFQCGLYLDNKGLPRCGAALVLVVCSESRRVMPRHRR